jgi:excisionase family DNA binding protein
MSLVGGDRLALTVTEAASVLGISRALAYELVARGELPSIRLGRRLVVPKVALLEMLGLSPRREV